MQWLQRRTGPGLLALAVIACSGEEDSSNQGAGGNAGDAAAGSGGSGGAGASGGSGGATGGFGGSAGSGGMAGAAGSGTAGAAGSGGTSGDEATILSFLPPSGARGVDKATTIVVTFSEPMNQASVEAAYASVTLPDVSFSWDGTGGVLTITPNSELVYASGTDPAAIAASQYSFRFDSGATAADGTPLAPNLGSNFSTLRDITQTLTAQASLTGYVAANGTTGTEAVSVGDGASNAQYKGFVSFDISTLAANIHTWTTVTLRAEQTNVAGAPYADLGPRVLLEHAVFSAINAATFSATSTGQFGILSDSAMLGPKQNTSVLTPVKNDYLAAKTLSQYMLHFETGSDNDGAADAAVFDEAFTLEVHYLAP